MPSQIREIIARNRRIIVIAVALTAISSYLIPFDKLMGANEAQGAKCPFPGINGLTHGKGLKYGIKKHINCNVDNVKDKVKGIKDGLGGTGPTGTSKPSDTSKSSSKPSDTSKSSSKPSDSIKDHVSNAVNKVKSKTSSKP